MELYKYKIKKFSFQNTENTGSSTFGNLLESVSTRQAIRNNPDEVSPGKNNFLSSNYEVC